MELPYLQRGNIVYLLYVQVCNNNYKERFNTNRILFIAFCWFIYTVNLNIMSNWSLIIVNLTRNLSFTYQNNYLRKNWESIHSKESCIERNINQRLWNAIMLGRQNKYSQCELCYVQTKINFLMFWIVDL